jgi:Replication-relaxation
MLLPVAGCVAALLATLLCRRALRRRGRRYVRLRVVPYRGDDASAEAIVAAFEMLHKRMLARWWRRLLAGQPSIALEAHIADQAWLAICCPVESRKMVLAALRAAYPNCRLQSSIARVGAPPAVLRLKKEQLFINRVKAIDRFEHEREPFMNRLLRTLAASGGPAFVQLAMTPASIGFERHAKRLYRHRERVVSRERGEGVAEPRLDRSMVQDVELRGGLSVQHRPLFFVDVRVIAGDRASCERIASTLRAEVAENRLVERGTTIRHGLLGMYSKRVMRGEGNPLRDTRKGVFASTELAAMWHLPSLDFLSVPISRSAIPVAPAPAAIMRPADGVGTLRDSEGPVSIHPALRRQNTAVVGTVEQGKSSYLVASMIEDLTRSNCAVILLDPKGDAAEAALSNVPEQRICTLLDFAHPTCGFNPLAVDAPADVIADYVVAALKTLFSDADIRASSDRYLRNAIIAVLAYDRDSTLWDAARLLSVGPEGYAYRARVGSRVRELPELKEIADFFTAELSAQLADACSTTTAKLDAPVNKLARLLNSPSIKRVLLNDSLRVDFEQVIRERQVLVVKGALGSMGAGNTTVLMQLLVGMLDAALARQQDHVDPQHRVSVAFKVDEAPLVLNRGFAETMALKRSAGLETVACWQVNAQWVEREVRDQLDALFAHRVYFATASVEDARDSASLMMAQFSDVVRPRIDWISALGHPDVRLHLPKHHAIASWSTTSGRQPPFVAQTMPLRVDPDRIAWHAERQRQRGGRYLSDLSSRHWAAAGRADSVPASGPGDSTAAPDQAGVRKTRSEPSTEAKRPSAREPAAAPAVRRAALRPLPETAAASYRELAVLDRSSSVRRVARVAAGSGTAAPGKLDAKDLQLLVTLAVFKHVLTTQLHRRHAGSNALTGTQRRLKKLADGGLIDRVQFHARDGGGAPMCCSITQAGREALAARLPPERVREASLSLSGAEDASSAALGAIRRDLRVAGWALALERALGGGPLRWVGADGAALSPPRTTRGETATPIGPAHLRLPDGRAPHNFLRAEPDGSLVEVERFETVRPSLRLELAGARSASGSGGGDLLVELDDRCAALAWQAKLARYEHFLAGWSLHTHRYGRQGVIPSVVFICRDRSRARECARQADGRLLASRAYAGEQPERWEHTGRQRIVFVAERDAHEGLLDGYAVPSSPPRLRAGADAAGSHEQLLETRSIARLLDCDAGETP